MTVDHLLAVVLVSDAERAERWYARLLDAPPTNRPMPTLAEWRVTDAGWVQVFADPDRAGRSALNLAVPDLDAARAALVGRGLDPGPVQEASKGVRLCALRDPDGNVVTLIGGFRPAY